MNTECGSVFRPRSTPRAAVDTPKVTPRVRAESGIARGVETDETRPIQRSANVLRRPAVTSQAARLRRVSGQTADRVVEVFRRAPEKDVAVEDARTVVNTYIAEPIDTPVITGDAVVDTRTLDSFGATLRRSTVADEARMSISLASIEKRLDALEERVGRRRQCRPETTEQGLDLPPVVRPDLSRHHCNGSTRR